MFEVMVIILLAAIAAGLLYAGRTLQLLHEDNVAARKRLAHSDAFTTRKVEEQNMHSVLKRIDALEERAGVVEDNEP